MSSHERLGVILLAAAPLLLAGCNGSPAPDPSRSQPGVEARPIADEKSVPNAEPSADTKAATAIEPSPTPKVDAAIPKVDAAAPPTIDLGALSSDPAVALPGTLVRHGRYEVRQAMHEGGFAVSMTEELAVHELGGRFVGRIASASDATPMPPSFLVFVMDDQRRLEHVIWRGLPGTSVVEHEFIRVSLRTEGPELVIVRKKGMFSSAIERVKVADAWALGGTVALEYLPLWSETPAARPQKAQWVSFQLLFDADRKRVQLEHRGKQKITVGKHEVEASHYETVGKGPKVEVWVDEQGLVVRRLEPSEDDETQTGWETIYVPLPGDPLSR
jgi:hypothetical protein